MGMGNGGMGNGEWEWGMGNGKWEWGEWGMGNGESRRHTGLLAWPSNSLLAACWLPACQPYAASHWQWQPASQNPNCLMNRSQAEPAEQRGDAASLQAIRRRVCGLGVYACPPHAPAHPALRCDSSGSGCKGLSPS